MLHLNFLKLFIKLITILLNNFKYYLAFNVIKMHSSKLIIVSNLLEFI